MGWEQVVVIVFMSNIALVVVSSLNQLKLGTFFVSAVLWGAMTWALISGGFFA